MYMYIHKMLHTQKEEIYTYCGKVDFSDIYYIIHYVIVMHFMFYCVSLIN